MRIAQIVIVIAVLLGFMPLTASAQDRPVHFNLGGGPTFVMGDIGERFNTGWGPAVGLTFDANEKLSFQFEYAYRWFSIPEEADATLGLLDANHQTHQLDFNLIANLTSPDSPVRAYIVGGPGSYYRKVEITRYAGTGVICDPYYYVCGAYPVEAVLGSRGGWDFGFNVGAGVGFALGEDGEFYIETRYHYVWGPEIAAATPLPAGVTTTSTGGTTNGQYMPLTFGFRF
jgi:opacity protein-like surface antigen